MTSPEPPTVLVERVSDTSWRFWCPYCRTYHVHAGGGPDGASLGHRVAHCHVPTSPFLKGGYILEPDPSERLT
jgi:hypothetical protein